jgi:hypothetical protein
VTKFNTVVLFDSDAMRPTPTTVPMSDRRYTLDRESRAFPKLRAALLETVRDKLAQRGDVDDAVIQQLVSH